MPGRPDVLVVASSRVHADAQEILRIKDTLEVLSAAGMSPDLLVPRLSPLLSAVLPRPVRVFPLPELPLCSDPPPRPSIRRALVRTAMFLRGAALASVNSYRIVHGFNDGAIVARSIARLPARRCPHVAEIHTPFCARGAARGPLGGAFSRRAERSALRSAAAIILPDCETLDSVRGRIPLSRVAVIPDPHAEITPEAFTYAEFSEAILHAYAYALRPGARK